MFKSARIKLTAFYLVIITTISLIFSLVVYRSLTLEIARGMRVQALRAMPKDGALGDANPFPPNFHRQFYEEAKERLALELILINLGIFVLSGSAGYFLAGKTLKPIAEMVDEQRRFVSDASHELRTPLTTIKTETEVALRDKTLSSSVKQLLESNLEEVDKLKSLTDYFLTLGKYQDSSVKLDYEVFNLSEAVEKACDQVQNLAKERKIKINRSLKNVSIEANKTSITEIVSIILDNAVKYSHKGGTVNVSTETKGGTALIRVEDFGTGMKASEIPYIFNRFYRADSSRTKSEVRGYGLGLSIAKSIIDLHKGKIVVESLVDKGSVFTVILPAKRSRKYTR